MGLINRKFIYEADNEDQQKDEKTTVEEKPSSTDTSDINKADDTEDDESKEDEGSFSGSNDDSDNDQKNEDSAEDDDTEESDFSINFDDLDKTGTEGGDDKSKGDTASSEGDIADPDDSNINNKIKSLDKELFDTLLPQEQAMKIKILKNNFLELYSYCDSIIDKYNSLSVEIDNSMEQIRKVLSILFDLKQMISDYLLNIFDYKSYIENDIMLNRYLLVLNSVKNITNGIKNMQLDTITSK